MSDKTHLIFGAGLIGGYVAGCLMSQGVNTLLVGRPRTQAAFRHGLTLTDFNDHRVQVPAANFWTPDCSQTIDVVWLAVKCTAVADCVAELSQILNPNTIIVCCQNGFGSDKPVRHAFPDNTVLNAVVGFNVAWQSDNHLHRSTDGQLIVAHSSILQPELQTINCTLLPTQSSHNMLADRWAKLQLNLANPVNALSDIPVKSMTETPGYRRIIADLMQELLTVTGALNLSLPKLTAAPARMLPSILRLPNWLFLPIAQKMLAIDPSARSSMWWDLSQGRPSEIEFINGAVVREARKLGLTAPLNQRIVTLVQRVQSGDGKIGISSDELARALYD